MKQSKHIYQAVMSWSRLIIMAAISVTVMQNTAFASGAKLPNVSANNSTNATDGTVVTTKIPEKTSGSGSGNTGTGSAPPLSDKYSFLDPGHEVPATLLSRAINYYETHLNVIANKRVIGVIDFKQHNSKERFYIIDLNTGHVDKYLVAHGKNSDPDYDGNATIFSNTSGSEASSVGFYLTAETYEGNHGYSLKLDGLSNTNSNARSRSIVMHPADYVAPGSKIGRSWGCPAVEPRYSVQIIDQLKGGALLYASNVY